jgi:hypothetical protein
MMKGSSATAMSVEQETLAKSETIAAYPGLGDQAFSGTLGEAGIVTENTLVAREGSIELILVSSASLSDEKTLEQHIFSEIS